MLDRPARRLLSPVLDAASRHLHRAGVQPTVLTGVGFAVGVAACFAAAAAAWGWALGLWLLNRLLDGLDGPLSRRSTPTDRGGFLDLMADFTVYGGFVLGVAVAQPDARLACAALLATYYVNGSAFLAFASLADGTDTDLDDGRSLRFVGGLAEGTETVIVHSLFCLLPSLVAPIAWSFAAVVAATAASRILFGARRLRTGDPG